MPSSAIAARFHAGLADAVAGLALQSRLALLHGVDTVALSGGVLQNKTLFEAVVRGLTTSGLQVLSHTQVPTNDGGLSLRSGGSRGGVALRKFISLGGPDLCSRAFCTVAPNEGAH